MVRALRLELQQCGAASLQLPLLHRAVVAAARCTAPILQLSAAVVPAAATAAAAPPAGGKAGRGRPGRGAAAGAGADSAPVAAAAATGSAGLGAAGRRYTPAEGADAGYDAARGALAAAEQAHALAAERLQQRPHDAGAAQDAQSALAALQQAQGAEEVACTRVLAAAGQLFLDSYATFSCLAAAVSDLDVLAAFAGVTADGAALPPGCAFCRPVFTDAAPQAASAAAGRLPWQQGASRPVLELRGLWHPLLTAGASGGAVGAARPQAGASGGAVGAARPQAAAAAGAGGNGGIVPNDVHLGGSQAPALLLTGEPGWGRALLSSTATALGPPCLVIRVYAASCCIFLE